MIRFNIFLIFKIWDWEKVAALFLWLFAQFCFAEDYVLKNNIALFFDDYSERGAAYPYGGRTNVAIIKDADKQRGKILQLQFDDSTYSGCEIALKPGKVIDLRNILTTGAIKFKVKGSISGQRFSVGLMDSGIGGMDKLEVKCPGDYYFDVTDNWKEVVVPLSAFSDEGERWKIAEKTPEYGRIDWNAITSVRFTTAKEQNYGRSSNRIATIFFDDIEIVPSIDNKPLARVIPWRMLNETVKGPLVESENNQTFFTWFKRGFVANASVYTYGDPTDFSVINTKDNQTLPILAAYLNDKDYSGVTIYRGSNHSVDVTPYREAGGIEFKVKGGNGGEVFTVGIVDDESDGVDRKVQCRIKSRTFASISKDWQLIRIPFSEFGNTGVWWDSDNHQEVVGTIDWKRISEVRFSIEKYDNKKILSRKDEPVRLYFSDIRFVKKSEMVSNDKIWEAFKSDSADKLIDDFNKDSSFAKWIVNVDPTTSMNISEGFDTIDNTKAIKVDYRIGSWGTALYTIDSTKKLIRDWSHHSAVVFDLYSSGKPQTCMIMVIDGSNEAWCANFDVKNGWQTIVVPFSKFKLFEWWQPENAVLNRKMDMQSVVSIDIRPSSAGKSGSFIIDNLKLSNNRVTDISAAKVIRINQLGYFSKSIKKFLVADTIDQGFALIDSNGSMVYTGQLSGGSFLKYSGEYIKEGDFSTVTTPGIYKLLLQESGEKEVVKVIDNPYSSVLNAAVKSYYYQRASMDLAPSFAGEWSRRGGHPDTACILHESTGKTGKINVTGGWYDAGDYGKYIVNGGISVGTLLELYELFPQCISDTLNIPESKNKCSDLLDEVKYELDWMKRMQDTDGGVFFKVGTLKWDGFIMPIECKEARYVIGKSTTSTLNFAAVMAMAGRIYKQENKEFSKDCVKRAIQAWEWAQNHPAVMEPSENGGTGTYGDSHYNDEFFWAACELYTTTKKSEFEKFVEQYGKTVKICAGSDWGNVQNLGFFSLAVNFKNDDYKMAMLAREEIQGQAELSLKVMDSIPYKIPSLVFNWGSNDVQLNDAILLCYAFNFSKKMKYYEAAVEIMDYIFGKNATGYSFVTGYGNLSPLQPHHRIFGSDDIDLPVPGFLVGGPNGTRQDEMAMETGVNYPFKEPARAYVDRVGAYASNETSINWNASLIFVIGFLLNCHQ